MGTKTTESYGNFGLIADSPYPDSAPSWLSAGDIEVSKGGVGRKPRTWLAVASARGDVLAWHLDGRC